MRRALTLLVLVALVPAGRGPLHAESPKQVKVRVTPVLSWFADDRPGVVEVADASTELIVPNGRPVVMGGSATTLHELTRQILGRAVSRGESETLMTLTATVLE